MMLDLSRLSDLLSDLMGGATGTQAALDPLELLEQAGIDPAVLQGLAPDDVAALLAEHGLDPQQILPELAQHGVSMLGDNAGVQHLAEWLNGANER